MRLCERVARLAAGRWDPHRSRQHALLAPLAGMLLWVFLLPAIAGEPPSEAVPAKRLPVVLEEFTIAKGERPILVPVKVQSHEYLFCVDTGMSLSSFDTSLKGLLGASVQVGEMVTPGGSITVEQFNPPEAFLGKLNLREGGPVLCTDLEMIRRVSGRDIRGFVGMGFLQKYAVRIDFDSGKLQFRSWDGLKHPEWGSAVNLYDAGGKYLPYAKGSVTGVGDIQFRVDTGFNRAGGLVTEVFAKAMAKTALADGLSETVAGTRHFRQSRISTLTLSGFAHRGLVMDDLNDNMLGLGLLSRYLVTLDFPSMKMYLQKGQAFDKPDEIDMSGLHLLRVEGQTAVHSVDKDSPAEAAGLRPNDVILKVGDKDATAMDIWDLRDLLKSGDGKEINMTIKRNQEEKTVSFKLKKKL